MKAIFRFRYVISCGSPRVGVDLIHPMSIKIDRYVVYIYVSNEAFGTWNLNKGAVLEMINCVIKFSLKTIYTSPDFNLAISQQRA